MTYQRFEEVPVWQQAMKLAEAVYGLTESRYWRGSHSLRDQIERAAISVSNNIAEGFERGTTKELLSFLYIARGSAGEVRSMLCFLERRYGDRRFEISDLKSKQKSANPAPLNLKSQISNLKSLAESCSRQLRAWADHLQNSDITGPRHLNTQTRKHYKSRRESEDFKQTLRESLPKDHPLRRK